MYSNIKTGYFKYQQNDVLSLSKEEIIDRLLKALLSNIEHAITAMKAGKIAIKGEKISRAIAIVGELRASLNFKDGGEIAEKLDMLYDYIIRELLFANIKNDINQLKRVKKVIMPIVDAWSEIILKGQHQRDLKQALNQETYKQIQAAV